MSPGLIIAFIYKIIVGWGKFGQGGVKLRIGCYFFVLKKSNQKNSRLQIILGLLF